MKQIWRNYWVSIVIGIIIFTGNYFFSWNYTNADISIFALLSWIILNQITSKKKENFEEVLDDWIKEHKRHCFCKIINKKKAQFTFQKKCANCLGRESLEELKKKLKHLPEKKQ